VTFNFFLLKYKEVTEEKLTLNVVHGESGRSAIVDTIPEAAGFFSCRGRLLADLLY
jgi:hypothetical protein